MTQDIRQIPIFPLHTVLYPGGALALRIFEPRYLSMVSDCLKNDTGFGICLISEGNETDAHVEHYEYGTFGNISYWQQLPEGLLGVTVRGQQRFKIISKHLDANRLCIAEVEMLPNEHSEMLPKRFQPLAGMAEEMLTQIGHPYTTLPKFYDDASWVGYRLAELLPIALVQKQYFLQLTDPIERLERLNAMILEMEHS